MSNEHKTASEILRANYERELLIESISRGIAVDYEKLYREMILLHTFGWFPIHCQPQEASEQFDRLQGNGVKLNLVKGQYEKKQ